MTDTIRQRWIEGSTSTPSPLSSIWTFPVVQDHQADPLNPADAPEQIIDLTIPISDLTAQTVTKSDGSATEEIYCVDLPYYLAGPADGSYDPGTGDEDVLVIRTASGGGGTAFTLFSVPGTFGSSSLLQARFKDYSGAFDFSKAQIDNAAVTDLYFTFWRGASYFGASFYQTLIDQLVSTQKAAMGQFTVQAVGNVSPGVGFLDATAFGGTAMGVRPIDNLNDPYQLRNAVWITQTKTHGQEVVVATQGIVTSPLALPFGEPIYIGQAGAPTWTGDTSGNEIVAGELTRFIGRRYDLTTTNLYLNMNHPFMEAL